MGDKNKEIDDLIVQECKMREEEAQALEEAAANEFAVAAMLQDRENAERVTQEALRSAEAAKAKAVKVEEDWQKAVTVLVVEDYLNKPRGSADPPPPKCEFSGETPVKMNMESLNYAHDVKPNMREKIIHMFVSMGDILYDTAATHNLRTAE